MKRLYSSQFFRLILILPVALGWAYALTVNTDVFILFITLLFFLIPGFLFLKKLKIIAGHVSFEHIGLAFGLSFGLLSLIGVPFLLVNGNFNYFYYFVLSAFVFFIVCAVFTLWREQGDSICTPVDQNNNVTHNDSLANEPRSDKYIWAIIFCLVVACDFFLVAFFFRGQVFDLMEKVLLFSFITVNLIIAVWYYLGTKKGKDSHLYILNETFNLHIFFWIILIAGISFYSYSALCNPYLDADDCTYVSTALKLKSSPQMNLYEPSLGLNLKQILIFIFIMWEVFNAFISKLTSIPPVVLMQYLLYPFLYIISFSALYYFFLKLFESKTSALIACILFMLISLKSNDYHTSVSNFFTMRLHQPKSIVNFIFTPLALGSLIAYIREKRNQNLILFFLFLFVTVSVHPFGFYQVFIPATFIYISSIKKMLTPDKIKVVVLSLLGLGAVIILVLMVFSDVFAFLKWNVSLKSFNRRFMFFPKSPAKILFLVFLPLVALFSRNKIIKYYFLGTTLVLGIFFVFKPTYFLLNSLSGSITWRFVEFIVPFQIVLIWILIEGIKKFNFVIQGKCKHQAWSKISGLISVIVFICLISAFLLGNSSKAYPESLSRISSYSRIQESERAVIEYIQNIVQQKKKKVCVLLPDPIAWMAPMFIDGIITPVTRSSITQAAYLYNNRWAEGLSIIKYHKAYYSGKITEEKWKKFTEMFEFDLIVNYKKNNFIKNKGIVFNKDFIVVYRNNDYMIYMKK
ncbi:MAG TPA: DUF6077 domain-containing protein [Spirochaetota bacterium]|nr:DUF6077 domain-containing protein [Spirochaetota bacterium]